MRKLFAEIQQKAWTAAALMGALAAACASMHLAFPTALAAMAAGAILMWKAEEKQTPAAAAVPRPAFRPAA